MRSPSVSAGVRVLVLADTRGVVAVDVAASGLVDASSALGVVEGALGLDVGGLERVVASGFIVDAGSLDGVDAGGGVLDGVAEGGLDGVVGVDGGCVEVVDPAWAGWVV